MPAQLPLDTADAKSEGIEADEFSVGRKLLGLVFTIEGTTASSQTLSIADLGRLVVDLYDSQRINVPLGFFHSWTRIHEGEIEATTPEAGDTRLSLFVPMWVAGGPVQTLPILSPSSVEADFQLDNGTLSTRFGSNAATASVRAVYADGVGTAYVPEYKRSTLQFGSANSDDEDFSQGNVAEVYVREQAGNTNQDIINRVDITVDSQELTKKVNAAQIDDVSTVLAETETAPEPWSMQDCTTGAPPEGYRNSQVSVDVTTNASGSVDLVRSRIIEAANSPALSQLQ